MNTRNQPSGFQQTLVALAMLAAFGPARAGDDALDKLTKPDVFTVSAGGAAASGNSKDRSIAGQYRGWGNNDVAAQLDFEYVQRQEETGSWTTAQGRNLGLDNRELRFSRDQQGVWKASAEYNEQVRRDPRNLNTAMQGVGSTQPTVNALAATGTGSTSNLDIKRRGYTLSAEAWVSPNLMLEGNVKSVNKEGNRLSGIGGYCSPGLPGARCAAAQGALGALLPLVEPTKSTTLQIEAKANLIGSGYSLTLGYYGSAFRNDSGSLRFSPFTGTLFDLNAASFAPGSGANSLGDLLTQPVALAPDNESYQIYLDGNYALTPTMRATFNYSVTHSSQKQSFAAMGLNPGAALPASLNGVLDTTRAQLGVTARPLPKLSLLANIRYEDVADKTPKALYSDTYINPNNSSRKANGKAEISYLFPDSWRGTFGVDYNWVKRYVPPVGSADLVIPATSLTSVRQYTNEWAYRAELSKPLSETLNGSVAVKQSYRNGSRWINLGNTTTLYPNTYQIMRDGDVYSVTGVFPTSMLDRKRESVRAMLDWAATASLSVQFTLEQGRDTYTSLSTTGLHNTGVFAAGLDASYAMSDTWKANAFVNYAEQGLDMNHSAGYILRATNTTASLGWGVVGKLSGKLEVGGDISYLSDLTGYGLGSGSSATPGSLPDVRYRVLGLKLYGNYALDTKSDVRVDLVHQTSHLQDWAWSGAGVPFAYSDNSTVVMQPNQSVTYLGVKYVYKFK